MIFLQVIIENVQDVFGTHCISHVHCQWHKKNSDSHIFNRFFWKSKLKTCPWEHPARMQLKMWSASDSGKDIECAKIARFGTLGYA